MFFINEVFTQMFVYASDRLLSVLTSVVGTAVAQKYNAVINYAGGWNSVLPLATIFAIAIPTFALKMFIRMFRLLVGFFPTLHG